MVVLDRTRVWQTVLIGRQEVSAVASAFLLFRKKNKFFLVLNAEPAAEMRRRCCS